MQYNPITKTLWDDDGHFLKRVHCPKGVSRDQLEEERCRLCDRAVVQIDHLPEQDALRLFQSKPDLCVSFGLEAPMIRIIPHDPA
jgi:hypothetical protein